MTQSTRYTIRETDHFKVHGTTEKPSRVHWVYGSGHHPGSSLLYVPSDYSKKWDGREEATHAIGSHHGFYSYVIIKVTGRKLRSVSGFSVPVVKGKITFLNDYYENNTYDCWLSGESITSGFGWE